MLLKLMDHAMHSNKVDGQKQSSNLYNIEESKRARSSHGYSFFPEFTY